MPEDPAFQVIVLVPAPPVIVPSPIIAQVYVAPGPASGTEAELSVEPEQASESAVIVQSGEAVTVTGFVQVFEQPLEEIVAVTDRTAVPADPAVQWIVESVCEPIIVPPVNDQSYVVPVTGVTEATLFSEPSQTDGFPVIVQSGEATRTSLVHDDEHPIEVFVMVTNSLAIPEDPAFQVIVLPVSLPIITLPMLVPVIGDQSYVAWVPPSGTDAELPVEPGQTGESAVIVHEHNGGRPPGGIIPTTWPGGIGWVPWNNPR